MAYSYPKQANQGSLGGFIKGFTNLHVGVILAFSMIFLWLNGRALWGSGWINSPVGNGDQLALAYVVMFGFAMAFTQRNSLMWLSKVTLKEGVLNFWIGFMMMFAGMIVLSQYLMKGSFGAQISSYKVYPSIALTAIFVAPTEETIFRGILKDYFKGLKLYFVPVGIIVTSALFAITHYAVYGGVVMSLVWAFIMGAIFYLATDFKPSKRMAPLGIAGAIGMHFCYNIFILGILTGGIIR
jgi:hypothetical protein